MKHSILFSFSLFAAALALPCAAADSPFQTALKNASASLREQKNDDASARLDDAARLAAGPAELARVLDLKLQLAGRTKNPDAVAALVHQISANSAFDVQTKTGLFRTAVNQYGGMRKCEEARALLAEILKMNPDDAKLQGETLSRIADFFWLEKKNDQAEQGFLLAALGPKFPDAVRYSAALNLINKIYLPKKRWDDLAKIVEHARKLNLNGVQIRDLVRLESNALFEQKKFDAARAALASLPAGTPIDAFERAIMLADLEARSGEPLKSADAFADAAKIPGIDFARFRLAFKQVLAQYSSERQFTRAFAVAEALLAARGKTEPVQLYEIFGILSEQAQKNRLFDLARAYAVKGAALSGLPENYVADGKLMPFRISFAENDLERAEKELEPLLAAKAPGSDDAAGMLALRYWERRQTARAIRLFNRISAPEKLDFGRWPNVFSAWDKRRGFFEEFVLCFDLAGQTGKAADLAERFASVQAMPADWRQAYTLIASLLRQPENVVSAVKNELGKRKLSPEQEASILAHTGKYLVRSGREKLAETVFAQREKLFAPAKRNQLEIKYVKNAPRDVGAWLSSPLLQDKKNRADVTNAYGAAEAAFLVTDVMASNRTVGDASVQADKETYFYCCYDEYGIHLFFVGVDSKVKDILAGRIGGSGYEMYLQLGEGQPPYQWLFDQPKDQLDMPPWNSPSPYFRRMDKYVTIASQPVENGIATAMNFSWDLAYDRLPENGAEWPFELIRWTRGGGVTWGGKCVWQIGSWGRLKFTGLTPEVLFAVRRILVYRAFARFSEQNNARKGGLIAIWNDPELGDPEFFAQALKPEIDRLNALGKLVSDDMSAETVEKLWVEAVPYWYDFTYRAAELRTRYLSEKLIGGGQ